jgi:hypothetical protein
MVGGVETWTCHTHRPSSTYAGSTVLPAEIIIIIIIIMAVALFALK